MGYVVYTDPELPLHVVFSGKKYLLPAGKADLIGAFPVENGIWVDCYNPSLNYRGLTFHEVAAPVEDDGFVHSFINFGLYQGDDFNTVENFDILTFIVEYGIGLGAKDKV